jgi:hypothetical protein
MLGYIRSLQCIGFDLCNLEQMTLYFTIYFLSLGFLYSMIVSFKIKAYSNYYVDLTLTHIRCVKVVMLYKMLYKEIFWF